MSDDQPRRRDQVPPDGWVTALRAVFDLTDHATWDDVLTACVQTKRLADRAVTEWHALLVARLGESADVAQRVARHEATIGTLISWMAQSATSPLSREEAARLLRLLEGPAPEETP
ncbi:MAG: hypothetical protein DMF56_27130 [Acidobacteria bacterium]|nr:MAG: hypothetical protein DMF56_27130 [Acidobacteriota bacterium]